MFAASSANAHSYGCVNADVDLDVSWLVPADLAAVDALARLQLAAARCGRSIGLHGADRRLVELLELVGLDACLRCCPPDERL